MQASTKALLDPEHSQDRGRIACQPEVRLALLFAVAGVAACAAPSRSRSPEPPFVEVTRAARPPEPSACLQPVAWNCFVPTTRREALEGLAAADLERAREPPREPESDDAPAGTGAKRDRKREKEDARRELAPRRVGPELGALGQYVACHPWDLELAFELAPRYAELNWHAHAAYLFLRISEAPESEDVAVAALLRALESLDVEASYYDRVECYDLFEPRVSHELARFCMPSLVEAHPARAEGCEALAKIELDLERLDAQVNASSRAHGRATPTPSAGARRRGSPLPRPP